MTETRKRRHRPSLTNALTQSFKAGAIPTSATIAPDGSVVISFGKRDDIESKMSSADDELAQWRKKKSHANQG